MRIEDIKGEVDEYIPTTELNLVDNSYIEDGEGAVFKLSLLRECAYSWWEGTPGSEIGYRCPVRLDGPRTYCRKHEVVMRERAARNTKERQAAIDAQKKLAGQVRKFLGSLGVEDLEALIKKHQLEVKNETENS